MPATQPGPNWPRTTSRVTSWRGDLPLVLPGLLQGGQHAGMQHAEMQAHAVRARQRQGEDRPRLLVGQPTHGVAQETAVPLQRLDQVGGGQAGREEGALGDHVRLIP